MITKELIEDAMAAGLLDQDGHIKPLWFEPWAMAITKFAELQRQRERLDVAVSDEDLMFTIGDLAWQAVEAGYESDNWNDAKKRSKDLVDVLLGHVSNRLAAAPSPELISPHPNVEELTKE